MKCKLAYGLFMLAIMGNLKGTEEESQKKSTSGTTALIKKITVAVIEENKVPISVAGGIVVGVAGTLAIQNRREIQKNCSIQ